jgi:hypothetical protein
MPVFFLIMNYPEKLIEIIAVAILTKDEGIKCVRSDRLMWFMCYRDGALTAGSLLTQAVEFTPLEGVEALVTGSMNPLRWEVLDSAQQALITRAISMRGLDEVGVLHPFTAQLIEA